MMNKEKIISLSLVGAIGLGSCMPAMAMQASNEPAAENNIGNSLEISQSSRLTAMEVDEDNGMEISKDDSIEKLGKEIEKLNEKIEEAKEGIHKELGSIFDVVRVNAGIKRAEIERGKLYELQHKEVDAKLEEASAKRDAIEEEKKECLAKIEEAIKNCAHWAEVRNIFSKSFAELGEKVKEHFAKIAEEGEPEEIKEVREHLATAEKVIKESIENFAKLEKEAREHLAKIEEERGEPEVIEEARKYLAELQETRKDLTELEEVRKRLSVIEVAIKEAIEGKREDLAKLEETKEILLKSLAELEEKTSEHVEILCEYLDKAIEKANKEFDELNAKAKEEHEKIDTAMKNKIEELRNIKDEAENKEETICGEIINILEQKQAELVANFEAIKEEKDPEKKEEKIKNLKEKISELGKICFEIPNRLNNIKEFIEKFISLQKIEIIISKLDKIYQEHETNYIKKICNIRDEYGTNYRALHLDGDEKYINYKTSENLDKTYDEINKECDEYRNKVNELRYKIVVYGKKEEIKAETYQALWNCYDKLTLQPEVDDLFKEIFGENFGLLENMSNQLKRAIRESNKADITWREARKKYAQTDKEYDEALSEHVRVGCVQRKIEREISEKMEELIKALHISCFGVAERCNEDVDKQYEECMELDERLMQIEDNIEKAIDEFDKIKDEAWTQVVTAEVHAGEVAEADNNQAVAVAGAAGGKYKKEELTNEEVRKRALAMLRVTRIYKDELTKGLTDEQLANEELVCKIMKERVQAKIEEEERYEKALKVIEELKKADDGAIEVHAGEAADDDDQVEADNNQAEVDAYEADDDDDDDDNQAVAVAGAAGGKYKKEELTNEEVRKRALAMLRVTRIYKDELTKGLTDEQLANEELVCKTMKERVQAKIEAEERYEEAIKAIEALKRADDDETEVVL